MQVAFVKLVKRKVHEFVTMTKKEQNNKNIESLEMKKEEENNIEMNMFAVWKADRSIEQAASEKRHIHLGSFDHSIAFLHVLNIQHSQ